MDYNSSSWEAGLEKCSQGQPGQQNTTMSKKEKLIMISTLSSGLSGSWLLIMIWFHSQNFFKIDAIFGIELYYFSVWSNLEDLEIISPFNVTFPFRTTLGEVDFLAVAKILKLNMNSLFLTFFTYICFMCMCILTVYMYLYHMFALVPMEIRREHQILWDWS